MLDSDELLRRQNLKVEEEIGNGGEDRNRSNIYCALKRQKKQSRTVDLRLGFIFRHQSISILLNHTTPVRQQRMVCFFFVLQILFTWTKLIHSTIPIHLSLTTPYWNLIGRLGFGSQKTHFWVYIHIFC